MRRKQWCSELEGKWSNYYDGSTNQRMPDEFMSARAAARVTVPWGIVASACLSSELGRVGAASSELGCCIRKTVDFHESGANSTTVQNTRTWSI